MYQKPHQKSERAIPKEYRFVRLPLPEAAHSALEAARREAADSDLEFVASQWKWHVETRFHVLRGGPTRGFPGSELVSGSGVDHPNLQRLPSIRRFLELAFPEPPVLAWLGDSPPGARIFLHVDNTKHWDEHHRIHVPLLTHGEARLCVDGFFQHLEYGSAWLLNNSVPHGAINRGPRRVHLMLDLRASEWMADWLRRGTSESGTPDSLALAELGRDPLSALSSGDCFDSARLSRLISQ
ncbi:MAG TPA: aspartyl/asparaginyl beta-hydroxylase domain-containing protein [Polyangiaceae bacterium]|nr:aspartyl/asparaginyl beta-hydroxylase domain-containing protein [Polyangiaceae bacterium]